MTLAKQLSVFYISIHHINMLIMVLGINFAIYLRAKKTRLLYSFMFLQGTVMLWMFAKILKTVSPTIEPRWFFIVLQYFAISLLEIGFLDFSHVYATNAPPPKWLRNSLIAVAVVQLLVVATNNHHFLFYAYFDFYDDSFGPLFYVYMALMYSVIVYGMVLCALKLKNTIVKKGQLLVVSLGILLPLVFNVLYILGYLRQFLKSLGFRVTFDFTPMAFAISLLIFVYAIYKYDFLDIMPIFKENIIKQLHTALVVTDVNGVIIELNETAMELLIIEDLEDAVFLKDYMMTLTKDWERVSHLIDEPTFQLEWVHEGRTFQLLKKPHLDHKGQIIGYIYNGYEISEYKELENEIVEKNLAIASSNHELSERIQMSEELSRISARNYVARELHDILGHSLTLAIKLLEIAKINLKLNKEEAIGQLTSAAKVSNKGYQDLKKSIVKNFDIEFDLIALKTDLKKMSKILEVAGVACHLIMPNENGLLTEVEYLMIKRFCQEGITNALKHGKASEVTMKVEIEGSTHCVSVMNNGVQPKEIRKGSGLLGIEARVNQYGGQLSIIVENGWFGISMCY